MSLLDTNLSKIKEKNKKIMNLIQEIENKEQKKGNKRRFLTFWVNASS